MPNINTYLIEQARLESQIHRHKLEHLSNKLLNKVIYEQLKKKHKQVSLLKTKMSILDGWLRPKVIAIIDEIFNDVVKLEEGKRGRTR